MTEETYAGLTELGHHVEQPGSPDAARLERVANPSRGRHYVVRFTCPEFTSLCPITGQPDFAHILIDYIPCDWIVESKSLKLYLTSFRNHGEFHDACPMSIAERLVALLILCGCASAVAGILAAGSDRRSGNPGRRRMTHGFRRRSGAYRGRG
jgi:7-cyano-7-deazaguanine reductase